MSTKSDKESNFVSTVIVLGLALAIALAYNSWDTIVLVLKYAGVIG